MLEKTITLSDEDWLAIDRAMQQAPFGQMVGIYQRMNAQFEAQNGAAPESEQEEREE